MVRGWFVYTGTGQALSIPKSHTSGVEQGVTAFHDLECSLYAETFWSGESI